MMNGCATIYQVQFNDGRECQNYNSSWCHFRCNNKGLAGCRRKPFTIIQTFWCKRDAVERVESVPDSRIISISVTCKWPSFKGKVYKARRKKKDRNLTIYDILERCNGSN